MVLWYLKHVFATCVNQVFWSASGQADGTIAKPPGTDG